MTRGSVVPRLTHRKNLPLSGVPLRVVRFTACGITVNRNKSAVLGASAPLAVCSVYRMRNYGKPKQECSFRYTGNRHRPEMPAVRGFHLGRASAPLAVCSVYRMRNYGKPKQECSFRYTGNRHPPRNARSQGISPWASQRPTGCMFGLPHAELRETEVRVHTLLKKRGKFSCAPLS